MRDSQQAFECPYCGAPLATDRDVEWQTCKRCLNRVNVAAQAAYDRGRSHFESIADQVSDFLEQAQKLSPRKARRGQPAPPEMPPDTRQTYQQAYAALRIALQHTLPDLQRIQAVEMLAKLSVILARRGMIAPGESRFWATLLVQAHQRREYHEIQEALDELETTSFSLGRAIERFNLRWQKHRRVRALQDLAEELDDYERTGLTRPPRVNDSERETRQGRRQDVT